MAETVKLVFEVENLDNASPATVSRCGIVYVSQKDLGYEAVLHQYLEKRKKKDTKILKHLIQTYLYGTKLLQQIEKELKEPIMAINIYTTMNNILRILNGLLTECTSSSHNRVLGGDDPKVQEQ